MSGDHAKIFHELCGVLDQTHDQLLEFELLPPSHALSADTVCLQDGNAIAIPKLQLVQAFLVARQKSRVIEHIQHYGEMEKLLSPLGVMQLMDPEHLTAANARKRILGDVYQSDVARGKALMLREMYFIDSLLTSRLHRHTKSPTLWSHRRWLCTRLLSAGLPVDVVRDLRTVIFVSAERHPRNYYAWCHARLLVEMTGDADGAEQQTIALIEATKKWCFGHHSDISGWSFLQFLLTKCHREDVPPGVFREVVALTESFRWKNESVWCFLRTLVTSGGLAPDGLAELHRIMTHVREGDEEDDKDSRVFAHTNRWLDLYSSKISG